MAVLKYSKKLGGKYWLTADGSWLDRMPLDPNENLSIPVNAFKVGAVVEIKGQFENDIEARSKEV